MSTKLERQAVGWSLFAGVILLLAGIFNIIFGLSAALDHRVLVGTNHLNQVVVVWDLTAWGWVHFGVGCALVVISLGLFAGATWARWLAIIGATINAVTQMFLIVVDPFWSILVIALDILVIWHLTGRYGEAYDRLSEKV
jgi:hypothetical protein